MYWKTINTLAAGGRRGDRSRCVEPRAAAAAAAGGWAGRAGSGIPADVPQSSAGDKTSETCTQGVEPRFASCQWGFRTVTVGVKKVDADIYLLTST